MGGASRVLLWSQRLRDEVKQTWCLIVDNMFKFVEVRAAIRTLILNPFGMEVLTGLTPDPSPQRAPTLEPCEMKNSLRLALDLRCGRASSWDPKTAVFDHRCGRVSRAPTLEPCEVEDGLRLALEAGCNQRYLPVVPVCTRLGGPP